MKKFFRVLIPIILAIAIIASIGWYLFIYDRDFTRDMLLQGARFFEDRGNHSLSSWFYDQAYEQASNNDAVAIELAEQHIQSGNFTKAEYTLTKAISDGATTDLYVALCKTYVTQDKLLDVVKLLDAVLAEGSNVDPQTQQQLQQMRPAAPTATPDVGFYSQYISASVSCETGTLYVNPNGEYPSIHDAPYSESIPLADGENTLYALAVSDNGLVSPLSIFGYTIGGVIEEVSFADEAMEAAIRQHLEVDSSRTLYTNDLWDLTYFTVPSEATDLSDLCYLTFVEDLALEAAPSGQLSYLSSLVNLTSLQIRDTAVDTDELKVIGSLPKLEKLTLSNCSIATTVGLETAANLIYLDLSENTIRNISALENMPNLQEVYLQNNALNDLSSLTNLSNLTKLDVTFNALTTLAPVYHCTSLTYLGAAHNQLVSLAGIEALTALEALDISHNQIVDVSTISSFLNMKELNISNNAVEDISSFSVLSQMTSLNFAYNAVTALPEFEEDCALVTIDGSHNQLDSLDALGGLQNLNNVFMDYNEGISSVKALADCNRLVQVKVYGTGVEDVSMLLEMDVVVEFDPTLAM